MDKLTIDEVIEHCEKTVKLENNLILKGRRCGGKVQYTKRYLEHLQVGEWLKELNQYKDLEEQGLLLKLPCKIGDTVYQLINSHIYEYKVIGICFDIFQNKWMYEVAYQIGLEWFKTMCDFDAFGKSKTVFLTKEEAEKALERLECTE